MSITLQTNDKAFGDGLHPSTELAASLLHELASQGIPIHSALDIGCGSGILSLALRQYYPDATLVASDIETEAVRTTRANLANNASANPSTPPPQVIRADGYRHADITAKGPYSLIMSNILADTLIRYAHDAAKHLNDGGFLITSGILAWRKDDVINAHHIQGLELLAEVQMEQWWALLFHKPAAQ